MNTAKDKAALIRTVLDAGIIAGMLERIDDRAMSADGPVTSTLREATPAELRTIYRAASRIRARHTLRGVLKRVPDRETNK